MSSLERRTKGLGTPSLAWIWYALPAFFVLHAIIFWGRGILDEEGMLYIQKYLANRSLLATIFDPNDTTLYQAREISYLFDVLDARVLGWLVDHGTVLFIPFTGAVGLVSVALIYLRGARRTFHFSQATSSLLLTLFLSTIVTQASTAIFYRSSKIVLSVALFAFLFYVASLFRAGRTRPLSFLSLGALFLLGLVMSLTDRQGLFYLLTTILILAVLWLTALVRRNPHATARLTLAAACTGAALAAAVYSFVVAPRIIAWTGGAGVSFQHQEQSLADFNWTLVSYGFDIFAGQVRYLFGNAPFVVVAGIALAGAVAVLWRRRSHDAIDVVIGAAVLAASLVIMLALMVLYHRPIYTIPDHTLWYYTLTVQAVLVFGLTLVAANLDLSRAPIRRVVHGLLLVMIASHVLHYHAQRRLMIGSRYFSEQYARTGQVLANDDRAREGRSEPGQRPWLRVEPDGAVVALPVEDEAFPREVQAAFASFRHRPPLDEATGPYWARLYEFLWNSPALLDDPAEFASLVDGLRSVGVRHIELGQKVLDLGPPGPRPDTTPLRQIPPASFHATASHNPDALARAFDGNTGTFWSTNAPQAGDEWIRIDFDRAIDVGAVQLFFVAANPGRNPVQSSAAPLAGRQAIFKDAFRPRGLAIDAISEDQAVGSTPFNPLAGLIQALLRNPVQPAMEFRLAPNRSRALVLRQTGRSATDPWNVAELTIWERR